MKYAPLQSSQSFYFSNSYKIQEEDIRKCLTALIEKGNIYAPYYGIPNCSPIDNEFEYTEGNDSCYTILTSYEFYYQHIEVPISNDIQNVFQFIKQGGNDKMMRQKIKELNIKSSYV